MEIGLFNEMQMPDAKSELEAYDETLSQIESAEKLGFSSAWFAQHHFNRHYSITPSPLVALAAVAQRTKRMRLGCAVSLLPFNNPIRNAEDAAVADILSHGRLQFGAGRGVFPDEFAGFGVDLAESRARFLENLELIRRCWTTNERFSHESPFHRFQNIEVFPKPVQKPHPPIWITAVSPESFAMVAERGFNLLVTSTITPFEELKGLCDSYRRIHDEKGFDPKRRRIGIMLPVYCAETREQMVEDIRPSIESFFVTLRKRFRAPRGGFPKEYSFYNDAEEGMQQLDFEHFCEEGVFGTPKECLEKLDWIKRTIGATEAICWINVGGALEHDKMLRCLRLLAEQVMPRLAS